MVRPQQPILRRPESWVTCGILLRPICRVFTRRLQVAMFRYKKVIGRTLHARTLSTQKTEAKVACKVINIMTGLGMPVSRRIA